MDYAAFSAAHTGDSPSVQPVVLQAELPENVLYRNDSTVNGYADSDPATLSGGRKQQAPQRYWGSGWNRGNQEIVYQFSVEKSGLYKLALRVQQPPGPMVMNAYRQILIDGEVPFSELEEYSFLMPGVGTQRYSRTRKEHPMLFISPLGNIP